MYFVKNIKKTFCTVKCVSKEAFFFFCLFNLVSNPVTQFWGRFYKI